MKFHYISIIIPFKFPFQFHSFHFHSFSNPNRFHSLFPFHVPFIPHDFHPISLPFHITFSKCALNFPYIFFRYISCPMYFLKISIPFQYHSISIIRIHFHIITIPYHFHSPFQINVFPFHVIFIPYHFHFISSPFLFLLDWILENPTSFRAVGTGAEFMVRWP